MPSMAEDSDVNSENYDVQLRKKREPAVDLFGVQLEVRDLTHNFVDLYLT